MIVVANLDSNHEIFASYSVLELANFDSEFPLYTSTKHDDSFCVKGNLEKCSLNITRSLLKQDFWVESCCFRSNLPPWCSTTLLKGVF